MKTSEKILAIHSENPMLTYRQIGKQVGVSSQRVQQVLKRNKIASVRYENLRKMKTELIRPLFMKNLNYEEISKITNLSVNQIQKLISKCYEMKTATVIDNQVFLFETIKSASRDWISGMSCEEICDKYNFGKKEYPKQRKSGIIHRLRITFGLELFPKRQENGVENIVEVYDKLKSEGKTTKEIFEIVGGYKNAESMYSSVRALKKKPTKE